MTKNTSTENNHEQTRAQEIVRRIEDEGNPDRLDGDARWQLFTQAHRTDKPWRDPAKLQSHRDDHGTIAEMADAWDCHDGNVAKWLKVFGIEPPRGRGEHRKGLSRALLEGTPEDFGLPPGPEESA